MAEKMDCEQCRSRLFDLIDDRLAPADRQAVGEHVDGCADCQEELAGLWQMQAMATAWRDVPVPAWDRRRKFFDSTRLPWVVLQLASTAASILVLVLVMGQATISTEDGLTIRFGGDDYAMAQEVDAKLAKLQMDQQQQLETGLERVAARQVASDQLIFRAAIEASRSERSDDLKQLMTFMEAAEDQQYRQTRASLDYLVQNQIEDRRDIEQLGRAVRLVASDGGTL